MISSAFVTTTLLAAGQLVAGHAAIIQAQGDLGGLGSAIAVNASTPRDGTRRRPFQTDSPRFRGSAASTCGETIGSGTNDIESGTAAVLAAMGGVLPQVSPGGQLVMTVHQVNADGAGPYTCMIDATGTGEQWTPIAVSTNVKGSERGRDRAGQKQDHPLIAEIPAGQNCTGTIAGQANVCMVRCQNPARAGPFGGCVPVQLGPGGGGSAQPPPAAAPPATGNGTGSAIPIPAPVATSVAPAAASESLSPAEKQEEAENDADEEEDEEDD